MIKYNRVMALIFDEKKIISDVIGNYKYYNLELNVTFTASDGEKIHVCFQNGHDVVMGQTQAPSNYFSVFQVRKYNGYLYMLHDGDEYSEEIEQVNNAINRRYFGSSPINYIKNRSDFQPA